MYNVSSGVYGKYSVELEDRKIMGKIVLNVIYLVFKLWLCFISEQ